MPTSKVQHIAIIFLLFVVNTAQDLAPEVTMERRKLIILASED